MAMSRDRRERLWRCPAQRRLAPRSGREDRQGFRHGATAIGKPGETLWVNAVAFDEAAQAELLGIKNGEALYPGQADVGRSQSESSRIVHGGPKLR